MVERAGPVREDGSPARVPAPARPIRAFTGLRFLCALGLAVVTWVALSRPFDPGQEAAPAVRPDPAAARAAAELPRHPGSVLALTYHGVSDAGGAGGTLSRELFRSEEHTSELQSRENLVCRLLLEKKKERPEATRTD